MSLVAWLSFAQLDDINPDCLYKELYLGMKTLVKDRKIEWILGNRKLELGIETILQQNM